MRYVIGKRYRKKRAPGSARISEEVPECTMFARCKGCPYPKHGFICWSKDGSCIRWTMQKINERR